MALQIRVDAQCDGRDALLDASPIARARDDLSAIAARATPETASAGLPLQYSCRELNLPLAPGAISYADGALERVHDLLLSSFAVDNPPGEDPVRMLQV